MKISNRAEIMPSSPIRKLSGIAQKIEAEGIKVYHLNIGQPDLPSPQIGLDALKKIDRQVLEYTPSQGFLSLRKKLCDYYEQYQIKFEPDDIIVTNGGSEAVLFAFMTCLNPGDEIIVPEPAYANYMAFAVSAGAVIKPIVSTIEDGFALPPVEKFEELITERTKGILICNPNNPTGYLYTRKEMLQLRDLVKKYDLYLFSDEVYREFIYTGSPYISACHLEGIEDHVILIDSVSKRYSECGIRIGAIATKNQEVRNAVMKFCQARLCPPLIGQVIAEASISAPREYMNNTYEEFIKDGVDLESLEYDYGSVIKGDNAKIHISGIFDHRICEDLTGYSERANSKLTMGTPVKVYSAFYFSDRESSYSREFFIKFNSSVSPAMCESIIRKEWAKVYPMSSDGLEIKRLPEYVDDELRYHVLAFNLGSIICILLVILSISSSISADTNMRRKEVAMRKINGAKASDIMELFIKPYGIILLMALVIGNLAAVALISKSDIGFDSNYILIALACLLIMALIIVISVWSKIRAIMRTNPADVIKSE